jgi:hypothetical protein
MATLHDLADVLRSKNAGPFLTTIDLMFIDRDRFDLVSASPALAPQAIARLYGLDPADVRVVTFPRAKAIKITFPRLWGECGAGSPGDRDVYGAQQHAPLLDIEIAS